MSVDQISTAEKRFRSANRIVYEQAETRASIINNELFLTARARAKAEREKRDAEIAEERRPRILCGWCSAPWSDGNLRLYDAEASGGCDTCGEGASVEVSIKITCHECGRLMYQKDGVACE